MAKPSIGYFNTGYFSFSMWIAITTLRASAIIRGPAEYCLNEHFNGQCGEQEVIRIVSANYGRMKSGKCLKTDMGLGCSISVINILHHACSGKSDCSYPVYELYNINPCLDKTSYLEISYECLPVLRAKSPDCQTSLALPTHGSHGYISSFVAKETGCGNMDHPWKIEVLPGQRANLTLLSFNEVSKSKSGNKCQSLGHIVESGHRSNTTICNQASGNHHVYTSNGRHVQIHIDTRDNTDHPDFIIEYQVFGCADVKVPKFAWYKREGDTATVGCEPQDVMWKLKCEGNQWKGVIGNCTESVAASIQKSNSFWTSDDIDLKQIGILSLAIGFVILITISGVVIICKLRSKANHKPPSTVLLQEEHYRMNKGPLPPVPQDNSHYRSLIRQPDPQAFPPRSQTMPRNQCQNVPTEGDYSTDYEWKFGTAPWQKPNV